MRLLRVLFIIAALSGVLWAEDINPPFAPGITITYTPPDPKFWKVAEREEQEAIGFVMYKRVAIVDKNGLSVEPCLAIVYRKVPEDVTDPQAVSICPRSLIFLRSAWGSKSLRKPRRLCSKILRPIKMPSSGQSF